MGEAQSTSRKMTKKKYMYIPRDSIFKLQKIYDPAKKYIYTYIMKEARGKNT